MTSALVAAINQTAKKDAEVTMPISIAFSAMTMVGVAKLGCLQTACFKNYKRKVLYITV